MREASIPYGRQRGAKDCGLPAVVQRHSPDGVDVPADTPCAATLPVPGKIAAQAAVHQRISLIADSVAIMTLYVTRLFRDLLNSNEVRLVPTTRTLWEAAAAIRAATNLRTSDALHAATSIQERCSLFITNGGAFRRVWGLSVVVCTNSEHSVHQRYLLPHKAGGNRQPAAGGPQRIGLHHSTGAILAGGFTEPPFRCPLCKPKPRSYPRPGR